MKKSITMVLILCTLFLFWSHYQLIRNYVDFMCDENPYILSMKPGISPIPLYPRLFPTKKTPLCGIYFSSNGKNLFYTRCTDQGAVMMHSVHTPEGWSKPEPIDDISQLGE